MPAPLGQPGCRLGLPAREQSPGEGPQIRCSGHNGAHLWHFECPANRHLKPMHLYKGNNAGRSNNGGTNQEALAAFHAGVAHSQQVQQSPQRGLPPLPNQFGGVPGNYPAVTNEAFTGPDGRAWEPAWGAAHPVGTRAERAGGNNLRRAQLEGASMRPRVQHFAVFHHCMITSENKNYSKIL